jgi:hypothetical protein
MKKFPKLLILALAVAIVGGAYLYGLAKSSHTPPSFVAFSYAKLAEATVLSKNSGFLRFDANDVSKWKDPTGMSVDLGQDMHFYYADENLKISDLLDSIKPVLYNEIVILYYSPNESSTGLNQGEGFYTFPDISSLASSNSTKVYGFSNDERFVIPAFRPFAIVSKQKSKIYSKHANIYSETDKAPSNYTFKNPLSGGKIGWAMSVVQGQKLSFLTANKGILQTVFLQDGENSFSEIKEADFGTTNANKYYILWLEIKEAPPLDTDKTITDFSVSVQVGAPVINDTAGTISIDVPNDTDLTALVPAISIPSLATVNPASGVPQNFSNPVTYTVTAEDGSTKTYTVTVYPEGSSSKAITTFSLSVSAAGSISAANVNGIINEASHSISVTMPSGTDLTNLTPSIVISAGATVSPASGVARNFSNSMIYTVTAADGSTQAYSVTAVSPQSTVPVITKPSPKVLDYFGGSMIVNFPGKTSIDYNGSGITLTPKNETSPDLVYDVNQYYKVNLMITYDVLNVGGGSVQAGDVFTLKIPKNSVTPALEADASIDFTAPTPPATYELVCPTNKHMNPAGGLIKIAFPTQVTKTMTYSKNPKITIQRSGIVSPDKVLQNEVSFTSFVLKIPYDVITLFKTDNYELVIPKDSIKADGASFLPADIKITFDTIKPAGAYDDCTKVLYDFGD